MKIEDVKEDVKEFLLLEDLLTILEVIDTVFENDDN